jgi:hypothetical protein
MQWMDRLGNYEVLNNEDEVITIEKIRLRLSRRFPGAGTVYAEFEDFPSTTALPVSDTELFFAGLGTVHGGEGPCGDNQWAGKDSVFRISVAEKIAARHSCTT